MCLSSISFQENKDVRIGILLSESEVGSGKRIVAFCFPDDTLGGEKCIEVQNSIKEISGYTRYQLNVREKETEKTQFKYAILTKNM